MVSNRFIRKRCQSFNDKVNQNKNDSYGYQFISIQNNPFIEKLQDSGF